MSTTLDLDDRLLAALAKRAKDTNRTLAQVVEEAAHKLLAEGTQVVAKREPVKLHTIGYSHFRPGINFSSNAELQDLMDELDGHPGR